ncbi:MAG: L,D-transpeptidase family protein [Deltaproteobacteria bacterium]|nr:L,D-transpeptidase family protein [Deltaproteobacteria bacterium]
MSRYPAATALLLIACGAQIDAPPPPAVEAVDTTPNDDVPLTDENGEPVADLPLGEFEDALDGQWGSALTCKPIPTLPPLVAPRVILSIEGLTVHVIDDATGYDRVFPAGVGKIENDENEASYGESLSYFPILATKTNKFKFRKSTSTACKTWWTDPETGKRSPVFAGLPFMAFYGGYAIHGPIDNYTAPNGGNLTRGFVSHGCFRMRADDILEIYARIGKLSEVPVTLQREPERLSSGVRTDADRFIGSECQSDTDCGFAGGFCHQNDVGGRGFCSQRCDRTCPDKAGAPTTFCVKDPSASGQGMCVVKVGAKNQACRPYDHLQPKTVARNGQPSVTASVCMPGSRGWIGDRCNATAACQAGGTCSDGVCTMPCSRVCPDLVGTPWTACVRGEGATSCLRQCTPASNASECAAGTHCAEMARASGGTKTVCALD